MQQCLDFMWALEVQAYTLLFAQQVLLLTAIFPDPLFLFLRTEVGVAGHLLLTLQISLLPRLYPMPPKYSVVNSTAKSLQTCCLSVIYEAMRCPCFFLYPA